MNFLHPGVETFRPWCELRALWFRSSVQRKAGPEGTHWNDCSVRPKSWVEVLIHREKLRHQSWRYLIRTVTTELLHYRCALERFFEAHTHGILWSVPHAVAVWRVAGAPPFYMMEPHACGPTGLRIDAQVCAFNMMVCLDVLISLS